MTPLVVTLLLAVPSVHVPAGVTRVSDGLLDDAPTFGTKTDDPQAARIERDRCLGAAAAGAVGVALGGVLGGAAAYGIGAIVQGVDVAQTTASKNFNAFAVPLGAMGGALLGAAVGTIGGYDV